jgi:NADH-quinone oxidoreductase subunit N
VVDDFSRFFFVLFALVGLVILLLSQPLVEESRLPTGEFHFLLLSSVAGMLTISAARDLLLLLLSLEVVSLPAFVLAGFRRSDARSTESALKFFLISVLATAVMLYGMSLVYGSTGTIQLAAIAAKLQEPRGHAAIVAAAITLTMVGFAFKISAAPFHFWAPDTYQGAPVPIAAFLAVASKAAGFAGLLALVLIAFRPYADVWGPLLAALAALTMTVGNLIALRQTNVVRMLAYSSIAQAGYMLVPFAVAGDNLSAHTANSALTAIIVYLLIYGAMNLGAFGVVIAVARKTRSGEIASFGGLFTYAPGLTVLMTVFLFSLAGIPPLGGWFAKLVVIRAIGASGTAAAWALGGVLAVNSVIALYYYANVAREMWMRPVPDGDTTPVRVPVPVQLALAITTVTTVLIGVLPNLFAHVGDLASLTHALGV